MNARLLTKQTTIIILTLVSLVALGIITTNIAMAQDNGKEERAKKHTPITQEQADEKLKGWNNKAKHHRKPMDSDAIKKRLANAVESGKITQEQADNRLKDWNNKAKHHRKPMDPDAIKKRLANAVESGKITQEQADEKLKGWNNKAK